MFCAASMQNIWNVVNVRPDQGTNRPERSMTYSGDDWFCARDVYTSSLNRDFCRFIRIVEVRGI